MANSMLRCLPFLVCLACLAGCQELRLKDKTVTLATTTSDLLYQQVLDNLARLIQNPATLPYFDGPALGTAQVQCSVQANYIPGVDLLTTGTKMGKYYFDKQGGLLGGSYVGQEAWQIAPLVDPDRLYLMQCAYRYVLGLRDPEGEKILRRYYDVREGKSDQPKPPPDLSSNGLSPVAAQQKSGGSAKAGGMHPLPLDVPYREFLRLGWFGVGGKKDVPRDACYAGHCCGTYVWVTRDHLDDLTKFTLAILDIYTVISVGPGGAPGRGPTYFPPPPPATLR